MWMLDAVVVIKTNSESEDEGECDDEGKDEES
jgi:hypothetical protein